MKRLFTFLMVVFSVLLYNCSGNEDKEIDNPDKGGNEKPENVTLDLSVTDLTFEATGGKKEFIVRSNTDWTIVSTTSWCQLSTDKGRTDEAVTVSVSAYTGMEDRNTNLTVKSGNVTKILSVTQKRKNAIVLSKDKFDVPQAGGDVDIEVKSNIQYEVTIPDEYKDWIKEAVKSKAVETKNFSFTISANKDYSKREGFIVFEGNGVKDTVWIYQAQIDQLILTKAQCNISSSEQTVEVELRTNVDFEVVIPDSVSGWVNVIQTKAIRTDKVNLNIGENEGYDSRNAVIIFKDKNSELTDTLRIKQVQKNAIILGQKKYDLPQVGGNITVEVQSNIQYQVTIPTKFQSWIKRSWIKSKALETRNFSFTISANEEVEQREGYIIFEGNSLKDTVKIYQEADTRKLILSNLSYLVPAEGKKVEIQLRTNIDFEVVIPDSVSGWISILQTRAMRTEYVNLLIGSNEEYNTRNAVIIFKDKNSELTDTLKINQVQKDVILLSQKKYDLFAEGGNITVEVQSNQNCLPSIPDEFKGWIKETVKSRALEIKNFSFTISANENFGKREGYIVFEGNSLKDTVRIYQSASEKIVFSESIINVDEKGGVFNVLLESNVDYRFEGASDYCRMSYTTELIRETDTSKIVKLTITVLPNLLFRDCMASIYARPQNYNLQKELKIKQPFGEYTYKGDITFYNETDIQNFVSQGYIKVDGNVTIAEGVASLSNFNNALQSMSGKLSIESSTLTNLEGLSGLLSIYGDLYITASHLQSFEGLSGLKEIGGDLRLNSMNELTSFKGMSKLMKAKGIYVENCSLIPSFEGLENFIDNNNSYPYQNYLETIYVFGCPAFKSFKGLEKLKKLKRLVISMCWAFDSFKELSNLTELGSLGCFHNFALTDFDGLNHITNLVDDLTGGLGIHGCTGLISLKGLEGLTHVRNISIMMCNSLRSFEGLENLESVKEEISIKQCPELYDFTFWESILMNFEGHFITEENGYNPTKEQILNGQGNPSNY